MTNSSTTVRQHTRPRTNKLAELSPTTATFAASIWLVLYCNFGFWRAVIQLQRGSLHHVLWLASLFVFVTSITYLLLNILTWMQLTKPLLIVTLMISAVIAHFISGYGIAVDKVMIRNVLQSDFREVAQLVGLRLLVHVLALGLIPALVLSRIRIRISSLPIELKKKVLTTLVASLSIIVVTVPASRDYASLFRNHRDLQYLLTPLNFAGGVHSYIKEQLRYRGPRTLIAVDAVRTPSRTRRTVVAVVVVGETARAANFSLGTYGRPTNPNLAARTDVFFAEAEACGTSTAIALPCIFSGLGRAGFQPAIAARQENVLDVLKRTGVSVLWRENNSGCKGVCDRIATDVTANLKNDAYCSSGECRDEILLQGLQSHLDTLSNDAVIVLHQNGSHGPAYYRRYPDTYRVFRPACETDDLSLCTASEVRNAYDNTLVYTDHVLAQTIALLEANAARFDTVMIYVSDHGESLGEKGIYLHGMPYIIAPREQKRVPMIVWMSQEFRDRRQRERTRRSRLATVQSPNYSHDYVFHSLLGLFNVRTVLYRPDRDIFLSTAVAENVAH